MVLVIQPGTQVLADTKFILAADDQLMKVQHIYVRRMNHRVRDINRVHIMGSTPSSIEQEHFHYLIAFIDVC